MEYVWLIYSCYDYEPDTLVGVVISEPAARRLLWHLVESNEDYNEKDGNYVKPTWFIDLTSHRNLTGYDGKGVDRSDNYYEIRRERVLV
jgi:hypothetical protein